MELSAMLEDRCVEPGHSVDNEKISRYGRFMKTVLNYNDNRTF